MADHTKTSVDKYLHINNEVVDSLSTMTINARPFLFACSAGNAGSVMGCQICIFKPGIIIFVDILTYTLSGKVLLKNKVIHVANGSKLTKSISPCLVDLLMHLNNTLQSHMYHKSVCLHLNAFYRQNKVIIESVQQQKNKWYKVRHHMQDLNRIYQ